MRSMGSFERYGTLKPMFRTRGTSAAKSSPLGRALRNLDVIRAHVTLQLDHTRTNAGHLHFGLLRLSRF